MELFWRQGFKATSMQDLVDHMEINRGSLYDTFGDKEQLYQAALDRYCDRQVSALVDQLRQPGRPGDVLRGVLEEIARKICCDEGSMGCLVTNSAVELGSRCDTTRSKVSTALSRMEDAFHELLVRDGERSRARAEARFLVGSLQGLAVVAKTAPSKAALDDVVGVILSAVNV